MPYQEGNEGCQAHNYEERQTGNSGRMSHMRDEDVQNRKELKLTSDIRRFTERAG